jgi:hypothetical protein
MKKKIGTSKFLASKKEESCLMLPCSKAQPPSKPHICRPRLPKLHSTAAYIKPLRHKILFNAKLLPAQSFV